MAGSFIPPTPIVIAFVSTASSFTQSATQQLQFITDRTNPQYPRHMLTTQDGLYMQVGTGSVFIAKANLYAVASNALAALNWLPIITQQPTSSTVTHPTASYFSVTATSPQYVTQNYQWYSSSLGTHPYLPLTNSAIYSGTSGSLLGLSSSIAISGSLFYCAVSNNAGTVYTNTASLTVL